MSRQRSTWSQPSGSRQAATKRRADIYTMNQERSQPSPTEYENGDPDKWAETPASNKSVEMEYDGDHVKRNEVGFGEFREDTFKHKDSDVWGGPGKYDNQRLAAAQQKASRVEHIARQLLRTDNETLVGQQMVDLMGMPGPVIASTLKRLEAVSPDALPQEQKLRRATACCKLAAHMMPGADEGESGPVERLAKTLMTIDDPTLKSIIRQVAAAKVAMNDEEDKADDDQTEASAPIADPAKDAKDAATAIESDPKAPMAPPPAKAEACGDMTPAAAAELDALLHHEMGAPAAPSADLTGLFSPPAPAAPMVAPLATSVPSSQVEIGFDSDDDPSGTIAADTAQLDALFADNAEVVAQREIRAAERAQALGYNPNGFQQPGARTASAQGARKLGQVQAQPPAPPQDELAALWR